jgi:chemotaxis signal transduction protein
MREQRSDQYILFGVAGTTYALPSSQIAHVDLVEQVTRVPNAAPFVDGVVFSRGQIVPAINMRARFGFERAAVDLRTRFLVANTGGRSVGLLVDSCREFLRIDPATIHPPADGLAGERQEQYVAGIATIDQRMIVILDLERLLAATDPILAA